MEPPGEDRSTQSQEALLDFNTRAALALAGKSLSPATKLVGLGHDKTEDNGQDNSPRSPPRSPPPPPVMPMTLLPSSGSLEAAPSELGRLSASKKAMNVFGQQAMNLTLGPNTKTAGTLLKKANRVTSLWNKRYFVFEQQSKVLKWYQTDRSVVPKGFGLVKSVFEIPARRGAYRWRIDVLLTSGAQEQRSIVCIAAGCAEEQHYWLASFCDAGFPPADLSSHERYDTFKRGMVRPSSQTDLSKMSQEGFRARTSSIDSMDSPFDTSLDGAYGLPVDNYATFMEVDGSVECEEDVQPMRRFSRNRSSSSSSASGMRRSSSSGGLSSWGHSAPASRSRSKSPIRSFLTSQGDSTGGAVGGATGGMRRGREGSRSSSALAEMATEQGSSSTHQPDQKVKPAPKNATKPAPENRRNRDRRASMGGGSSGAPGGWSSMFNMGVSDLRRWLTANSDTAAAVEGGRGAGGWAPSTASADSVLDPYNV
jgi:hypothetical protein